MDKKTLIRDKVLEFVSADRLFTSVDITKAIWEDDQTFIRCSDVRRWLKGNMRGVHTDSVDMSDYVAVPITVLNGTTTATLYLPRVADPDDYTDRAQDANFQPTTQTAHKARPATPVQSTVKSAAPDLADVMSGKADTDSDGFVLMKKRVTSTERIKIPGEMIRQLGWQPGDVVDVQKIKTHEELPVRLRVNDDNRVSIPRAAVHWDRHPVNVLLTKDMEILFEKA